MFDHLTEKYNLNFISYAMGSYYIHRIQALRCIWETYDIDMWQRLLLDLLITAYNSIIVIHLLISWILRCLIVVIAGPIILLDIIDVAVYCIRLLKYVSRSIRYKILLQLHG